MFNNGANFNIDFSSSFLGEFLKNINLQKFLNDMKNIREIFENTELFEIYACIILTLIDKNDTEHYFRLKELLIKNRKGSTEWKSIACLLLGNMHKFKSGNSEQR